jgi:hypothetical protein
MNKEEKREKGEPMTFKHLASEKDHLFGKQKLKPPKNSH